MLFYLNDCSSEYSAISISVDDFSLKHVKLSKSCSVVTLFLLVATLKYIYLFYFIILFHIVLYPMVLRSRQLFLSVRIKPETQTTKTTIDQFVTLVTAISEIFELCLSKRLNIYLTMPDNQFGFKAKHSTDMCIYAVKSVVECYNHFHSPVYTCFLDARKALDRINHWTLFSKLIARGVSCPLVRIIMF